MGDPDLDELMPEFDLEPALTGDWAAAVEAKAAIEGVGVERVELRVGLLRTRSPQDELVLTGVWQPGAFLGFRGGRSSGAQSDQQVAACDAWVDVPPVGCLTWGSGA